MEDKKIGYDITAIAAGIDSFERFINKGKGIIGDEGLVPLYLGKDLVKEKKYDNWEQVETDIEAIGTTIDQTSESPRKMFLVKLVESLRMATLLFRGGDAKFEDKLIRHVGVPAESISEDFISGLADKLDSNLSRTEFKSGKLRDRIIAWEASHKVEPNKVATVFRELMTDAQERTDRLVVPTNGYTMELNPVTDMHYTARCNFSENKMDLNVGMEFSRAALKHLVAHECFPGHSTQNIYTLKGFKQGTSTADVLLCSLNGITGVLQEGIGDQGVYLIDWIEDVDDEIYSTLRRYQSAVATQGAWMINVEKKSDEEAYSYMRDVGAMQGTRIKGRIGMAHHAFRGPFIASYFYGNEAVRLVRLAVKDDPEKYKAFIKDLYGNMHSPESLCLSNGVEYRSYGDS